MVLWVLTFEDCQWFVVSDIECDLDLDTLTFKLKLTLTLTWSNIDYGQQPKKILNPKP